MDSQSIYYYIFDTFKIQKVPRNSRFMLNIPIFVPIPNCVSLDPKSLS